MPSFFEIFPSELIEIIFRYLSGLDIYLSFRHLNHRFDMLIANYRYLSFDFRSVSKLKFDSIMKYIRPSDIYALTLSNSRETIGQIELFLSYWDLCSFINLRSLYLHQINQDILSLVSIDIVKLSSLSILRIDGCDMDGTLLLEHLSQLRYLQYLYVPNFQHRSWNNYRSPLNRLTHIHRRYRIETISHLFNLYSSLRSVSLIIDPPQMINSYVPSLQLLAATIYQPLTQLSITWQVIYWAEIFHWNEIEQLLQGLSTHLKHLTLNIPITTDVLDGHKWQRFLTNFVRLKTFNVKFHLFDSTNWNWEEVVDQFRSPFWSKEKKWYFTVINNALCSLSLYDGTIPFSNLHVPHHTAPNDDWFYSYPIIKFDATQLTEVLLNNCQRSKHLFHGQELQLIQYFHGFYSSSSIQLLEDTVDLSYIRKLRCIGHKVTSTFFLTLMQRLPDLIELEICFTPCTKKNFKRFPRFERIQRINHSYELSTKSTKDFIRIFPNVKHLVINVQLRHQVFQLIDELIYLESAEFHYNSDGKYITRNELIQRTHLGNHSFTSSINVRNRLTIWINPQLKRKFLINCNNQNKFLLALFIFILLIVPLIVCIVYFL